MSKLYVLRTSMNLTQKEMSEKLGIGVSTYCMYEKGHRRVPSKIAHNISLIIDVKVEEIFIPTSFMIREFEG